jgi:hypothetical protein
MAARPETMSISKKAAPEETIPEPVGQRRPKQERFQLQVDRQTKATYTTIEAAEKAGRAIKQAHPIVQVAVYDTGESVNTIIEAS